MSNDFLISDTHLQHEKLLTFGSRKMLTNGVFEIEGTEDEEVREYLRDFEDIAEHDQAIEDNWNSVVGEKDTVYHIGDVSVGGPLSNETIARLKRLKGRKILILGNHDTWNKIKEYMNIFDKILGSMEIGGDVFLQHTPVHPNQLARFGVNIHGHMHDDIVERETPYIGDIGMADEGYMGILYKKEVDPRYVNVSCEQVNMTPIAYDVIRKRLKDNGAIK